jgi:hypothetical protein
MIGNKYTHFSLGIDETNPFKGVYNISDVEEYKVGETGVVMMKKKQ